MTDPSQLDNLDTLYRSGVLSEAEYQSARARLIAGSSGSTATTPAPTPQTAGYLPPPPFAPPAAVQSIKRRSKGPLVAAAAIAALVATIIVVFASQGGHKKTAGKPIITSAVPSFVSQAPFTDTPTDIPTEAPTPTAPTAFRVGGLPITVTIDGADVAKIYVTQVLTAAVEPGEFGQKPQRDLFLIVRLKAVGVGAPFDVNAFNFYITGRDGSHSEDATFSSAWGASFSSGTIHNGERVDGTIVYDVPAGAAHGKFAYSPNSDNEPLGVWAY